MDGEKLPPELEATKAMNEFSTSLRQLTNAKGLSTKSLRRVILALCLYPFEHKLKFNNKVEAEIYSLAETLRRSRDVMISKLNQEKGKQNDKKEI